MRVSLNTLCERGEESIGIACRGMMWREGLRKPLNAACGKLVLWLGSAGAAFAVAMLAGYACAPHGAGIADGEDAV